jgi:peptidoglycan-N-acetylglucosamine deacetylase
MTSAVPSSVLSRVKNAVFDVMPGVLRRGPTASKRVALTFDDGPDHMTARYLDVMDELGVPGTFFLLGDRAVNHPDLVRAYVRRGHQIAGHGFDHKRFTKLGRRALLDQCDRTDLALGGQLSGRSWVRPPHGALDPTSLLNLLSSGRTVAMWSLDSLDYESTDGEEIAARCASATAGEVLLFHEGQQWTLDALPIIVRTLRDAGLECVTMHDLFAT